MLEDNFIYEEDLPVFDWKIFDDKQEILSYQCQKATTSFRGRDYVAWFAPDIPVPNGPWKFGGLPGLILKLSDSENNFVYECQGLEQLKRKEPILYYKVNYTKISRKELDQLYRRFHDDFAAYQKSLGRPGVYIKDAKTGKIVLHEHSNYKLPYNPIELE
jgi:GLPGLI family protein